MDDRNDNLTKPPRLDEDRYFLERDHELLQEKKRNDIRKADRAEMGKAVGITGDLILSELQELNYNVETRAPFSPQIHRGSACC